MDGEKTLRSLGEIAYAAYFASGQSLVSGSQVPTWAALDPHIQAAWEAAGAAVAFRNGETLSEAENRGDI